MTHLYLPIQIDILTNQYPDWSKTLVLIISPNTKSQLEARHHKATEATLLHEGRDHNAFVTALELRDT